MQIIKQKKEKRKNITKWKFPLSDIQCCEIMHYTLLSIWFHPTYSKLILLCNANPKTSQTVWVAMGYTIHDAALQLAAMAYPQADDTNNFTAYFLINGKLIFSTLTADTRKAYPFRCVRCTMFIVDGMHIANYIQTQLPVYNES